MVDTRAPHRPRPFPSQDANAFGQDRYGYWQDLLIRDVVARFRWVPPGRFEMGSDESDQGRFDNETQHSVVLTTGYWLAETACTQALWQAVAGGNPSKLKGEQHPVENISWLDVQEMFIPVLADFMGDLIPHLPTEAEWEYACRAGTATAFSFGDKLDYSVARYLEVWNLHDIGGHDKAIEALKKNDRYGTCPVTDFEPNPWGFRQMHGNVYEWCLDWLTDYPIGDVINPEVLVEPGGGVRVLRGGSWGSIGRNLRSARRLGGAPGYRGQDFGFRLALGPMSSGERSD